MTYDTLAPGTDLGCLGLLLLLVDLLLAVPVHLSLLELPVGLEHLGIPEIPMDLEIPWLL